jgi:ribonuclease P protein component
MIGSLGRVVLSPSWDNNSHMAVIVSKKVVKTSVGRHRIKRRTQTVFSSLLGLEKPVSIILFPTRAVLDTPFENIEAWREEIRKKI